MPRHAKVGCVGMASARAAGMVDAHALLARIAPVVPAKLTLAPTAILVVVLVWESPGSRAARQRIARQACAKAVSVAKVVLATVVSATAIVCPRIATCLSQGSPGSAFRQPVAHAALMATAVRGESASRTSVAS